jgi:uncharacterized protein YegL
METNENGNYTGKAGYTLPSPAIIISQQPSVPLDVVLAFDRSGSMYGDKINSAKEAVKTFIGYLKPDDRAALVSFSDTATLDCGLTGNHALLQSTVDNYQAGGMTNMGDALKLAINELNTNGRNGAYRVIIYFTDGQSNIGPTNDEILGMATYSGLKIYTVGYGSDVDEFFLKQVAHNSGGEYYFAPDAKTLQQIYLKLSEIAKGWLSKASFTGSINLGQTVTAGTVNVSQNTGYLKCLLSWPGSDLDLILLDPNGNKVVPGGNVTYSGSDALPEYYEIQNPMPGTWTIQVYGKDVVGSEDYDVEVFEHGAVLELDPSVANVQGTFTVSVKLNTYGSAITQVKAYLNFSPDKLEVASINYSNSIITSWVKNTYDNNNGTISLQGSASSPGFVGEGLIATITFKPKFVGTISLSFDPNCLVLRSSDNANILGGTINGSYNASPIYTITATAGSGGTITPSGAITVNYGGSQSFTTKADPGYFIYRILVDNVSIQFNNPMIYTYTFNNVTANHTISAEFMKIPDTTPPTVMLPTINGVNLDVPGAVITTNSGTFSFTVSAYDESGIGRMVVKVNGVVQIDKNNLDPTIYLSEGVNTVEVTVYDTAGNYTTKSFKVISDTKPPVIDVTLPETVSSQELTVKGTVVDLVTGVQSVTVNDNPVIITLEGNFETKLALSPGANTVIIEATDNVGNKSTKSFTVSYIQPQAKQSYIVILKVGDPNITVNGISQKIDAQGSKPIIKNGRALLPIRTLIESLGGVVEWNSKEQKVTITLNGHSIVLWIGKNTALVDGSNTTLDVAPTIITGRTYLPLRFISENLGASVDWDNKTQTITIYYWP